MRRRSEPDRTDPDEGPSKSERKRVAHAAQRLGETLVRLNDAELAGLGLPEPLHEAIVAARGISSRAGLARQRQYIGRLMRGIDTAAVSALLQARAERAARDARHFHLLEHWRERLLTGGPAALDELQRLAPQLDRGAWERRILAARAGDARGAGARELFRALRELLGD